MPRDLDFQNGEAVGSGSRAETPDHLFKADLPDGYYHLRLRNRNRMRLAFFVGDRVLIPLNLKSGLSVTPWFFTKAIELVVGYLRKMGHRVYAYLDEFNGAVKSKVPGKETGRQETQQLGSFIHFLFKKLGLTLKAAKREYEGTTNLEILGIIVDKEEREVLDTTEEDVENRNCSQTTYPSSNITKGIQTVEGFTAVFRSGQFKRTGIGGISTSVTRTTKFLGSIEQDKKERKQRCNVQLIHTTIRDLKWWARISVCPHVGRSIWTIPDACVLSDARMSGWGAVW